MAGFARKFPFSERRATMRTWSRGVGLLLLVASGVPNAVFVEEIVGSAAAICVLPPCGQIYLGRSTGCSTIHEPHGYSRHSSEARPLFHRALNRAELRSAGQPRAAVPTWFVPLPCYAALLGFLLGNVTQQDVAGRNQAFEFLALHDGQMAEAKLPHEVQTVFNSLVHADRFGIGRHHFRDLGAAGHASEGHNTVHDIPLGEDTYQLAIAQHGQSANAMFHHEAGAFEHSAVGFDRQDPAILHKIIDRRHERLLSESAWGAQSRALKCTTLTRVRFRIHALQKKVFGSVWNELPFIIPSTTRQHPECGRSTSEAL